MDFVGKVKTNHFVPKVLVAVEAFAKRFNLRWEGDETGITLWGDECSPCDGETELDWEADLLPMVDGVLTVTEVGSEGFRYLHGRATAYKEGCDPIVIDLMGIEDVFDDESLETRP